MKAGMLYTLLFCAASVGFVGWRVHAARNQPVPHFALVGDLSISHTGQCESLVGLAEQVLHEEASSSSTLTVLIIGDQSTANEPWQLGRYSIPTSRRVIEGRNANIQRQEDVLHDILAKCQAARRTTISPIFLGVKQAIADLRAQGCSENSRCQLLIDSDLEDNAETSIQKSLTETTGRKPALPSPVNNEGIDVAFCGIAATAGRLVDPSGKEIRKALPRDPGREDRLQQTWQSLFTKPEAVRFGPYCPNPRDLGADATFAGAAERNH